MPELADVEGFRRLLGGLDGAEVGSVEVMDQAVIRNVDASGFRRALRRRRWRRPERIGKWLLASTDGPTIVFHFGMTGSLIWEATSRSRQGDDRLAFVTDAGELRFRDRRRLGRVYLATSAEEVDDVVGELGPDALGVAAPVFRARLAARRSTIKAALLDQAGVAGLGNFLSDEVLWRAGIDPVTRTDQMSDAQWKALHGSSQSVLRAAARAGHTPRGPRWLTGARWGDPALCPSCGGRLERRTVAGRTSVWCPICQGAESRRASS